MYQEKIKQFQEQGFTLSEAIQELQAEQIEENIIRLYGDEKELQEVADEDFEMHMAEEYYAEMHCEEV